METCFTAYKKILALGNDKPVAIPDDLAYIVKCGTGTNLKGLYVFNGQISSRNSFIEMQAMVNRLNRKRQ